MMNLRDAPGFIGLLLKGEPHLTRFAVVFERDGDERGGVITRIAGAFPDVTPLDRADLGIGHVHTASGSRAAARRALILRGLRAKPSITHLRASPELPRL